MKYQIIFSVKKKKRKMSSAELAQRVVMVNMKSSDPIVIKLYE